MVRVMTEEEIGEYSKPIHVSVCAGGHKQYVHTGETDRCMCGNSIIPCNGNCDLEDMTWLSACPAIPTANLFRVEY